MMHHKERTRPHGRCKIDVVNCRDISRTRVDEEFAFIVDRPRYWTPRSFVRGRVAISPSQYRFGLALILSPTRLCARANNLRFEEGMMVPVDEAELADDESSSSGTCAMTSGKASSADWSIESSEVPRPSKAESRPSSFSGVMNVASLDLRGGMIMDLI